VACSMVSAAEGHQVIELVPAALFPRPNMVHIDESAGSRDQRGAVFAKAVKLKQAAPRFSSESTRAVAAPPALRRKRRRPATLRRASINETWGRYGSLLRGRLRIGSPALLASGPLHTTAPLVAVRDVTNP
jgi:hypothetical protein